jgi:dTDP-4-dehydrorhamnose 3,5-epimerase
LKIIPTKLKGLVLIQPEVFTDSRGYLIEQFREEEYSKLGIPRFVQDTLSQSRYGVIRGLHGQKNSPQGKLVTCLEGEIFDVAVDARKNSRTYGMWEAYRLNEKNHLQFYMPPGFLHGFCSTSSIAKVLYKCSAPYDPNDQIGVKFDDLDLEIHWPNKYPHLSEKDQRNASFKDL